jgi:ABC-type branched-subunit amino acid transport system ATPase component/branched-subunit amino acid ABC-type transport system permease component
MTEFLQYFLSGLSSGCMFALLALGLVVIAKVTGVYNFAQGSYAMVGGMVYVALQRANWPVLLAVLASVLAVTVVAFLQERLTVAPVRATMSPLGLAVITLGVGAVINGTAMLICGTDVRSAPSFNIGTFRIGGAALDYQTLWVWISTAVALVALFFLFQRTVLGKAMRACAANPIAARLLGIPSRRMSTLAFVLAGALTGLAGAIIVPLNTVSWSSGVTIGLVGFIAAAIADFERPVRAVVAGLALGVVQNVAAGELSSAYRDLFVYGALFAYLVSRDLAGQEGFLRRIALARTSRRTSRSVIAIRRRREALTRASSVDRLRLPRVTSLTPAAALGVLALAPVFFVGGSQALSSATVIVLSAIGATGLVLAIGLAGLFNLGQAAFYLVSGYVVAILTVNHGWNPLAALVVGTAASVIAGLLVGAATLRLQGFNLAIATLSVHFALLVWVTQDVGLAGGAMGTVGVPPLSLLGFDLSVPANFYWAALIALGVCLLVARNLTRSRIGRALRAIGSDEAGARSVGLNVFGLKLLVFTICAGMAGLGGGLWACFVQLATPATWDFNLTISLVTFAIVGGVRSVYGGLVGAVVVGGIQYWVQTQTVLGSGSSKYEFVLTGAFLVICLLIFRDGLAVTFGVDRVWARVTRRAPAVPVALRDVSGSGNEPHDFRAAPDGRSEDGIGPDRGTAPLLQASGLTKRFGGFTAVHDVELTVLAGQITAMIGPNGAGKSTVINMLSGALLPTSGQIRINGHALVGREAESIAKLGLARTFQTPKLFEGLTTLETIMLARDRFSRAGALGAVLRSPRARRDDEEARRTALEWLEFVGLVGAAQVPVSALPVGSQRLVEVARALAAEPDFILFDEPAADLDHSETERLAELLRFISASGIGVLLVEHDMQLVMSTAQQVVVLDAGSKIAAGTPIEVGANPQVIEAYLGVLQDA